ncbi:base excision DNA repair protein, HhH-GPD family [Treponema phagedenis F0421]|uniref:base excision DNA repair protein, HhH-GPD family n=1 Tax=Treponema phagedenis TaxID=162 RepID=UPI0001F6432E|nr:base excision DNA repair protein, HhH-GPD family [Treponema phagedenis F0421]
MTLSSKQIEDFQKRIINYYKAHGRNFPWRETADPYEIMVSEFMLQQTQTERVVPKYLGWLERFPTVKDLADTDFMSVLTMWSGLGYNRRARFLHEAAKKLFPSIKERFLQILKICKNFPELGRIRLPQFQFLLITTLWL